MTEDKKELTYQYACKHYLRSKSLEKLRAYGRSIGVSRSAAKNKDVLIEDIVGVLSGRLEPTYTKRGAPVLNDSVDPQIPETIKKIYEEIFEVVLPTESFDFYKEYQKIKQNPNTMVVEEPERALRENGTVFTVKKGQLQQLNGVYYLLPLDGKDNGEYVVMHTETVAQCGLLDGDVITCEAAQGQTAFIVANVTEINGVSTATFTRRETENAFPCEPSQTFSLYDEKDNPLPACKFIQWLAPIRKGQRCCVIAPPKTGKTRLLQDIAYGIQALHLDTTVLAFLVDQALETVGQFAQFIPQENLVYTTYDDEPTRQIFLADFILKRAKRLAESGKDVVLFVDSFNGLAKVFNDTEESVGGKTLPCGLETKTLQYIKKYVASSYCIEGKGTLTIIGTSAINTGNPFDDIISAEIAPLANHEIRLSEQMALKRIYPAIDKTQINVERRTYTAQEQAQGKLIDGYLLRHSAEELLQCVISCDTYEEFENRIKERMND